MKYTLNDPLFRYALTVGMAGEEFLDRKIAMVVGGGATQLNMISSLNLLRPTTDIDIMLNGPSTKGLKKYWSAQLSKKVHQDGKECTFGLNRFGAEVKFCEEHTDLLIHLDCFGENFYNRHERRINSEYERANSIIVDNYLVRFHSPIDVILNKIRRIKSLENIKGVNLDSSQKEIINLICDAQFNDIDTENMDCHLRLLLKKRSHTLEDIGRWGYTQVFKEIESYKINKDIYDIFGMINQLRKTKNTLSSKEFKQALDLVLQP